MWGREVAVPKRGEKKKEKKQLALFFIVAQGKGSCGCLSFFPCPRFPVSLLALRSGVRFAVGFASLLAPAQAPVIGFRLGARHLPSFVLRFAGGFASRSSCPPPDLEGGNGNFTLRWRGPLSLVGGPSFLGRVRSSSACCLGTHSMTPSSLVARPSALVLRFVLLLRCFEVSFFPVRNYSQKMQMVKDIQAPKASLTVCTFWLFSSCGKNRPICPIIKWYNNCRDCFLYLIL